MNEKLIVITQRWGSFGLHADALQEFGHAIQSAIRTDLETPCTSCKNNDWSSDMDGAWKWVWAIASQSMVKTLVAMEADDSRIVRECWEVRVCVFMRACACCLRFGMH